MALTATVPVTRGANFTSDEFEALAKAWMHASEDSITGVEQKGSAFYKTVHVLYNSVYKPTKKEKRPLTSVTNKCKDLHKECFHFAALHLRVCRLKPSGASGDDLIKLATALYNNVTVANPNDDCGPPFKYLSAWEVFRKHKKFMSSVEEEHTRRSSPKKTASAGEKTSPEGGAVVIKKVEQGDEENSMVSGKMKERPVGRRKAKELLLKQRQQEHKLKVAQALVETQKDRNKTLKRQLALHLFRDTTSGGDGSEAAEFFKLMREEALEDLRSEREKRQKLTTNSGTGSEIEVTQVVSENTSSEQSAGTSN